MVPEVGPTGDSGVPIVGTDVLLAVTEVPTAGTDILMAGTDDPMAGTDVPIAGTEFLYLIQMFPWLVRMI
jgi:hypothetical protein